LANPSSPDAIPRLVICPAKDLPCACRNAPGVKGRNWSSDSSSKKFGSWNMDTKVFSKSVSHMGFEPMPCAIYTRVSTDEQAKEEHYSLEAQEEYCMAEIRKRQSEGWVYKETLTDPGYSGFTYDRPGLIRLIQLAKASEIKVIVVYKRERLFRNADLAAQVQAIFDATGVRVHSYVEGIHDSSPHSVLMRQFIDANAQFERANSRKRIIDCLRFAAKRGDWQGGTPSFGYRYTRGTKILVPDEKEALIVKYIFEQIGRGIPVEELVADLKAHNVVGRVRKPNKRRQEARK
jgi:site-specific DNA recombinase